MKRAARDRARAISDELLGASQHFLRRAARESEQQNSARRHAALDQPRDSIDQRASLARSRARDDQQRPVAMRHGGELRGIQQLGVLDFEVALVGGRSRLFAEINYLVGHVKRDVITPRDASYDARPTAASARCPPGSARRSCRCPASSSSTVDRDCWAIAPPDRLLPNPVAGAYLLRADRVGSGQPG